MAGNQPPQAQTVDADANDPFAVHFPLKFPITQRTPEEQERDWQLEHALNANQKTWDQLYGRPEQPAEGLGLKFGHTQIPLAPGFTIWDLREAPGGEPPLAPNVEDRIQPKGPRFGLSWSTRF